MLHTAVTRSAVTHDSMLLGHLTHPPPPHLQTCCTHVRPLGSSKVQGWTI